MKERSVMSLPPTHPTQQHFFTTPHSFDVGMPPAYGSSSLTVSRSRSDESRNPQQQQRMAGQSDPRTDPFGGISEVEREIRVDVNSLGGNATHRKKRHSNQVHEPFYKQVMRQQQMGASSSMAPPSVAATVPSRVTPDTLFYGGQGPIQLESRTGGEQHHQAYEQKYLEEQKKHLEQQLYEQRFIQAERRDYYKLIEQNKHLASANSSEILELRNQLRSMEKANKDHLARELAKKDTEIEELKRQLSSAKEAAKDKMASEKAHLAQKHAQDLKEVERTYKNALAETVQENELLQEEFVVAQEQAQDAIDALVKDHTQEIHLLNEALLNKNGSLKRECEMAEKQAELSRRMVDELTEALEIALNEKEDAVNCCTSLQRENDRLQNSKEAMIRELEVALAENDASLQKAKESATEAVNVALAEKEETLSRYDDLLREHTMLQSTKESETHLADMIMKKSAMLGEMMEKYQVEIEKLKDTNNDLLNERDDLKEELICVLESASVYQDQEY